MNLMYYTGQTLIRLGALETNEEKRALFLWLGQETINFAAKARR